MGLLRRTAALRHSQVVSDQMLSDENRIQNDRSGRKTENGNQDENRKRFRINKSKGTSR